MEILNVYAAMVMISPIAGLLCWAICLFTLDAAARKFGSVAYEHIGYTHLVLGAVVLLLLAETGVYCLLPHVAMLCK